MTQYVFGSGTLIGKRTDVTNTKPALLGTITEASVDFSRKIEPLVGQKSVAVAFGGGTLEIKGKAKFARYQATQINNLFLNGTLTASSGLAMATSEAASVPASSTYTVQVAQHSTFVEDLGVYYASTGIQLQPVTAASEATGKYSIDASTGTYTFASGDASAALLFTYTYTVTTENKIALSNSLMGPIPTFEMFLKQSFVYFGSTKTLILKLNACVSDKLSLPFTNTKFSSIEFDFEAGEDAAGEIGIMTMTE